MEEQIEEIYEVLVTDCGMPCHECDYEWDDLCVAHRKAEALYDAGYRKRSDVIDEFAKRLKEKLDISVFGVSSEEVAYCIELTIDGIVEEMKGGAE